MAYYSFGYYHVHQTHYVDPVTKDRGVAILETDYAKKGLFTNKTVLPGGELCAVSEGLMQALDTARLKDTCYRCYEKEEDPAGLQPWGQGSGHYAVTKLRLCDCGVVSFCSHVSSFPEKQS